MVQILDATLREGEQTPGVYFNGHMKLAIADLLDQVGVEFIEAGHPLVNEGVYDAVKLIANRGLNATIVAHSRSMIKDVDTALDCGVGFLGIFYCVSNDRLSGVFKTDFSSAVSKIQEVISYAKQQNPELTIRFTPEDTVRSKFENVVEAAVAAVESGAEIISIADTTGHMIPGTERNMYDYVLKLKEELRVCGVQPKLAVHCHNDRGLALANALDAYRAGIDIIDTTVLGLGERAGLVDLAQLMIVLKSDFNVDNNWNLEKLLSLYRLVSREAGVRIPVNFPITGSNAFTHCAGVHTHAAQLNPLHYQSVDPAIVGRKMQISLDNMSGTSSIRYALNKINQDNLDKEIMDLVLEQVKVVGQSGKTVNLDELKHIVEWCKEHRNGTELNQ